MRQGWRTGLGWGQGNRIQRVLQDRLHALIATCLGQQRAFRRRFHALWRVLLRQANDAQTGTIAHLRMGLLAQDPLEQLQTILGRPVSAASLPFEEPYYWAPFTVAGVG